MNKRQRERYRKQLVAKRESLLQLVKAARSSETEANDKEAPDLGDRALSTVIRDLSYQLTAGERDILRRVDASQEAAIGLGQPSHRRQPLSDPLVDLVGSELEDPGDFHRFPCPGGLRLLRGHLPHPRHAPFAAAPAFLAPRRRAQHQQTQRHTSKHPRRLHE